MKYFCPKCGVELDTSKYAGNQLFLICVPCAFAEAYLWRPGTTTT